MVGERKHWRVMSLHHKLRNSIASLKTFYLLCRFGVPCGGPITIHVSESLLWLNFSPSSKVVGESSIFAADDDEVDLGISLEFVMAESSVTSPEASYVKVIAGLTPKEGQQSQIEHWTISHFGGIIMRSYRRSASDEYFRLEIRMFAFFLRTKVVNDKTPVSTLTNMLMTGGDLTVP